MKKDNRVEQSSVDGISRRRFLTLSQGLLLSTSVLSLSPLSIRASDIEALKLKHLGLTEARLLADTCRLLFPHEGLADSVYLGVVADIESDMDASVSTRKLLAQAATSLNAKAGGDWTAIETQRKIEILASIQGSELFNYLHNRTIESLYRNPEVWKLVGYQGSSVEYGGYLHRGFDDIDWLEE